VFQTTGQMFYSFWEEPFGVVPCMLCLISTHLPARALMTESRRVSRKPCGLSREAGIDIDNGKVGSTRRRERHALSGALARRAQGGAPYPVTMVTTLWRRSASGACKALPPRWKRWWPAGEGRVEAERAC